MTVRTIEIYDTTLRDGTQGEDVSFTVEDKLRVAEKLDLLGVHYIEGGWPGASPKDTEFFSRAKKELKLKKAIFTCFGSTRRADHSSESDKVLNELLAADTKIICIFGKSWDLHVRQALRIPLKKNLELIEDSVAFLKKHKRQVFYDAEHFFDGFKANKNYALQTLKAASRGGADRLVLCDTNGGSMPHEIEKIIGEVRRVLKTPLAIHCHNDGGVAVANSMAAVRAGAIQVQGTMNGIGERCGNANLCTMIANLELKMGTRSVGSKNLTRLQETSQFIYEIMNRTPLFHQPYVGKSAFAHKGGIHVHAILKNAKTYEHVDPRKVGNVQRVLLSDLSGISALIHKLKEYKIDLRPEDPRIRDLLVQLKELEKQGYQFEGAEASFEIFIKKVLGQYKPHFVLHDFKVTDEISMDQGGGPTSEAVIHLAVDGREEMTVAKGVGPVHAIDQALRKALERFYPQICEMKLLDYKVRVLPAGEGTAAVVRVLIECGDAHSTWGTVGVSGNIIHASYQALVDSIDYQLMKDPKPNAKKK